MRGSVNSIDTRCDLSHIMRLMGECGNAGKESHNLVLKKRQR